MAISATAVDAQQLPKTWEPPFPLGTRDDQESDGNVDITTAYEAKTDGYMKVTHFAKVDSASDNELALRATLSSYAFGLHHNGPATKIKIQAVFQLNMSKICTKFEDELGVSSLNYDFTQHYQIRAYRKIAGAMVSCGELLHHVNAVHKGRQPPQGCKEQHSEPESVELTTTSEIDDGQYLEFHVGLKARLYVHVNDYSFDVSNELFANLMKVTAYV
ncbi:MAG: hypothetical protein P0S94_00540 [Simkaniaceae bacterium]|nr:hypothetical protein [Simkaniaceae bacterium]